MLTFSTAQLRFANSLSKNSKQQQPTLSSTAPLAVNTSFRKKSSLKIKSSKPQSIVDDYQNYDDVPLSIEYVQLLEKTLSPDEEDFLQEGVSSRLAQPLDAKSVFCPNASLLSSKYVAPKITALDATRKELNSNPIDALTDAKSRLNVLWLRRKADLFREEGNYASAVATLEEAIEEHLGVGPDYKELGTEAYLKANLSQPALSSDPVEILSSISKNMFLFDQSAHLLAGKIQRSYHRRYVFKQKTATMIARIFRGHLCRRRIRKEREVQRQCAVIIQRRFRIHLRRMHALATKLKRWFFLRKDVKTYQRKLRIYQMARRIQRLFRGNRGRAVAEKKRMQLVAVRRIQRHCRRHVLLRERAFPLTLFHKLFFLAARRIQTLVRRLLAVKRAQIQLLVELTRERVRYQKERIAVEEILRLEKARSGLYARTPAGSVHLRYLRRYLRLTKKARREAQKREGAGSQSAGAEEAGLVTRQVIEALEYFDDEGSGSIGILLLKPLLDRLLVPASKQQLLDLQEKLDPDSTGYVNLASFLDWYCSEDADAVVEPESPGALLRKGWLRLSLHTRKTLRRALDSDARQFQRALFQDKARGLSKEIIGTFRLTRPPKYQCCQCLKPFAMFTDYYVHFDSKGCCGVLGQKALFFPRYWIQEDWIAQRQCEYEVSRANDEYNFVRHRCCLRVYGHLALLCDARLRQESDRRVQLTYQYYVSKFGNVKPVEAKAAVISAAMDLAFPPNNNNNSGNNSGNNSKDGGAPSGGRKEARPAQAASSDRAAAALQPNLSLFAADCIAESFRIPMVEKFVLAKDELYSAPFGEVRRWLGQRVRQAASSGDTASFADESANLSMSDVLQQLGSGDSSRDQLGVFPRPRKAGQARGSPLFSEVARKNRLLGRLAALHVNLLRIHRLVAQEALSALTEFRARRPRRITLSDAQLDGQLDLAGLTESVHDDRIASLVRDLQRTEQQLAALYSIHNQLSLGLPAVLPSLDLTPPPATKVSLISAVGRFLAAALLRRPAAVQVDPRPAEEWRLERQREHAKVADQMRQLQVSIPGLAEIDLAELLAVCYAEERRSRGRGALALRRRIGNELWAQQRRWEEEQAGGGSKAADAKRIRFVYHKLTYWSSGGDNDAGAGASIAPAVASPCGLLSSLDVDLLNEELGILLPQPLSMPYSLPIASEIEKASGVRRHKKSKDRLKVVLDKLDPGRSGVVSLSALQAWTAAGAHMDHGTLLTSWPRQVRRVLGLLGGPRYEFATEHARSTLRAEIRRRGRAQLSMQGSLQQLLGELFAPAPPPPPPADTAGQGAPEKAVDEEAEEEAEEGGGPLVEQGPPQAAGPSRNAIPAESSLQSRGRALSSIQEAMNEFNSERLRKQKSVVLSPCPPPAPSSSSSSLEGEKSRTNVVSSKVPKPILVSKRRSDTSAELPLPPASSSSSSPPPEQGQGAPEPPDRSTGTADAFLSLWRRFALLRARREDVEDSLLFSMVQERSSRRMAGQLLAALLLPAPLAPPARRAQWVRERQLVREMRALLRAFRSIQPRFDGSGCSPDELSALEVWLRCFDVDCAGSFDENSLRVILRAVRRNIDTAQLLHDFPHMRTPGARTTAEEVVRYVMQQQQQSTRVGLRTVSDVRAAWILLTAWSFCVTRKSLQQSLLLAVVHPGGRELLSDRKSLLPHPQQKDESASSGAALSRLVRAQLLALRQLRLFLRTSHGQIVLAEERARVRSVWEVDLGAQAYHTRVRTWTGIGGLLPGGMVRVEAIYALKFAYSVHCEHEGMLVTELPYFVEYMHKRMHVTFSRRDLDAVQRVASEVRSAAPRWLSLDDVALLLADFCGDLSGLRPAGREVAVRRSIGRDALCRMRSQARQQARCDLHIAVLVALNYQHIRVPETNYRCAVLGLHAVMEKSRRGRISLTRTKKASEEDSALVQSAIPVEAAALFVLSRGLPLATLYQNEALAKELGLGRFRGGHGALRIDVVSVRRLLELVGITSPSAWFWSWWSLRASRYAAECRSVAKALLLQGPAVDSRGAAFLAEIVTGVSSFSARLAL